MQIGNVTINGKLALAPMAGVTDLAFRHICRILNDHTRFQLPYKFPH